jgi:hypothetical protein
MQCNWRMFLQIGLATTGLLVAIWFYNFTVTSLDRAFFLSNKKETIIATYVDWMCNCANFVDTTSYKTNPVTEPEGGDYFFIEAARPGQPWNRDHFIQNRYVKLTGQFYLDEGIPEEYKLGHLEDKPDHARIFRFEKYRVPDN